MSQIITVKTDIKSFKSLEAAAKNLKFEISGNENQIEMSRGRTHLTATKDGEFYSIRGDSDWMGRSGGAVTELRNEYAKEEALAWAKFTGRTVLSVKGSASTGYEVEISA